MEKSLCLVCFRGDQQVKVILHFIRKRLQRISREYIPQYRDENDSNHKQPHAFARLLSTLLGSCTASHSFWQCPHLKFSRYLRRKLKCDNSAFHDLCNQLLQKMAQRNYQIEVLNMQLRNLSDTCLRLSQQPQADGVLALNQQKREISEQTLSCLRSQIRVNEPSFLQPMFNQWNGVLAGIPLVYVNVGMTAQAMQDCPFRRNDPN